MFDWCQKWITLSSLFTRIPRRLTHSFRKPISNTLGKVSILCQSLHCCVESFSVALFSETALTHLVTGVKVNSKDAKELTWQWNWIGWLAQAEFSAKCWQCVSTVALMLTERKGGLLFEKLFDANKTKFFSCLGGKLLWKVKSGINSQVMSSRCGYKVTIQKARDNFQFHVGYSYESSTYRDAVDLLHPLCDIRWIDFYDAWIASWTSETKRNWNCTQRFFWLVLVRKILITNSPVASSAEHIQSLNHPNITEQYIRLVVHKLLVAQNDNLINDFGEQKQSINWSFINSFFFAITVITTIGYGHLTATTVFGKCFFFCWRLFFH